MVLIDKQYLEDRFGGSPSIEHGSNTHPSSASSSISTEETDEAQQAFSQIERLVNVRDRSIAEVRKRLHQKEYSDEVCEAAIARALTCGYLDDRRFAEVLIRSRLRAGKGIPGIVRELKGHHILAEDIPGFPDCFLEEAPSQEDAALNLLMRKPPRSKNQWQGAYSKLLRAGYSSAVASDATRKWMETLR